MVKNRDGQARFEDTVKRYAEIKSHILQQMKLSPNTSILEVVGDSAPFSPMGIREAMRFLQRSISPHNAIVYGYNGYSELDGTKCVNGAVSAYIAEQGLVGQTIGSLVGFHTPMALDSWGYSGPQLRHYLLIYGEDESNRDTGTLFGDDITTSDFLSDRLLMLEGGIQSFRQACNFLLLGRPIVALTGLRSDMTAETDGAPSYFTASEFLQFIKDKVEGCNQKILSDAVLNEWRDEYFCGRLLSNPKKGDCDARKKLFNDAWQFFKVEKLYTRLHLFRGENVRDRIKSKAALVGNFWPTWA